jgi:hypothetical protein
MKRNILIFLFILLLIPVTQGYTQNDISAIESMSIGLWPDYDRPSVLVLLTGLLPADTQFPATVIVPLPENAKLNAVARIDGSDGIMKNDISVAPGPSGMLMFITTDLQFRVEYYIPYIVNGNQRSFDYSWLADIDVNSLQLKIQQPEAATSFNVKPATINRITEQDGLIYHAFPAKAVLAGQSFFAHLEYEMLTTRLSVNTQPSQQVENQAPEQFFPSIAESRTNLPVLAIIAGGLLVLVGLVWIIVANRNRVDTNEPHSQKPRNPPQTKFCRNCGEPTDETDKWCGQCGTYL